MNTTRPDAGNAAPVRGAMKGENMKEDLKEILDRHRKWIYG